MSSKGYRYFLELAFDGTAYHGWQIQRNALTVQQVLNETLGRALGAAAETSGCGRTDTGVHAAQFFAHFDSEAAGLESTDLVFRLNAALPGDISVLSLRPVTPAAHARYDACSRTYRYVIARRKDPFLRGRACYLYGELDTGRMEEAARLLQGRHDFRGFSKTGTEVKTTECNITEASWHRYGRKFVFTVTADRFLRNMVRAIAGTLVEAGQGKMSLDDVRRVIDGGTRSDAGYSMPACGLFLTAVRYPEHIFSTSHPSQILNPKS